jgi:hypothetical protein
MGRHTLIECKTDCDRCRPALSSLRLVKRVDNYQCLLRSERSIEPKARADQ